MVVCMCVNATELVHILQRVGVELQDRNLNTAVFQLNSHSPPVQTF